MCSMAWKQKLLFWMVLVYSLILILMTWDFFKRNMTLKPIGGLRESSINQKVSPALNNVYELLRKHWFNDDLDSDEVSHEEIAPTPPFDGFRDQRFSPLLMAYMNTEVQQPSLKSFRNGSVPRFLIWSDNMRNSFWREQLEDVRSGLCPVSCEFTQDPEQKEQVDAIVIYLRRAPNAQYVMDILGPRDPRQPWVALSFEAPPRANSMYHTGMRVFNGFFNRTMLYRQDSDVVVPHGFVVRQGEEAQALPEAWRLPHYVEQGKQTRKTVVTFISNCRASWERMNYVREMQKFTEVDVYGKCGNLTCGHRMYVARGYQENMDKCYQMAGKGYLFYLAFENSLCNDYVTEKVYNLLYYPIVPVVYGANDYSSLLPPNSFIDAREYTPQQLSAKLDYLAQHRAEYLKYLEWRKYFQPSTVGGERTMCHLCVRLHDPTFYHHNVVHDFYDWFVTQSHCNQRFNTSMWYTP